MTSTALLHYKLSERKKVSLISGVPEALKTETSITLLLPWICPVAVTLTHHWMAPLSHCSKKIGLVAVMVGC